MTDFTDMIAAMRQDLLTMAAYAVEDSPRHSKETLFNLLAKWFPEAPESLINEVVDETL